MDLNTILSWFKRGCKPTEAQFAATFSSFRHKDDPVPMEDVTGLSYALANKAENRHTHTLADITDYDGGDKEVLNAMVANDTAELEAFTKTVGMYYILLADQTLYQYVHDEDTDTDTLTEVDPDGKVVYSAYDADDNLHIYLYNVPNMEFQDVTNEQVDKTIYTNDLDTLITRQLKNGIYSVVHINSGIDDNTYGDAYTLTVGDGSISSRVLECRSGWAQTVLVDENYQWQWHRYSYNGHTHQMSDVEGLGTALGGKAAANHNHDGVYQPAGSYAAADHTHSQYLTQHQDISGKQDKTDNSLLTTVKTIVGAINELWNKFADYAQSNHNHDGVYQPAGSYAAADHTHSQYLTQHQDISGKQDKTDNSLLTTVKTIVGAINELWNKFADYALSNHNHDGVYQPAGSYAAGNHNHDGVYQPAGSYAAADHTHSQYLTQHQDISGKQDKTDNSLLTTVKTIVGAINELWTKFKDYLKGIQHVTHAELVALRDNGELVPGQQYRITDFVTTVANDTEARSAGHPFDIIAVADDATTLNENARAVKHAGDTYFQNSKLSAWKLKYSLDNDTTRWFHADPENGKGVIYFMEDEFGNIGKCDFKNFQYKRYKVTDDSADGILGSLDGQYVGFDEEMKDLIIEDMNDYIWAYAASMPSYTFDDETEELEFDMQNQLDATLNQIPEGAGIDADGGGYAHPVIYCKGNKFTAHQVAVSVDDGEWTYPMRASNIVLFCYPKYFEGDDDIPARIEFENSADNVFAPDCNFITMNGVSARNTFLTAYSNIIFGGSVGRSIFKGQYSCCTFGGNINGATFGGDIGYTTFGGNLHNGHIHGYLYNVSIGSAGETWSNLVIDPGVEYVSVTCTESGDADIKNVHIFGGVSGTYDNPITVSIPTRNNALLEIKPTTKTEISV